MVGSSLYVKTKRKHRELIKLCAYHMIMHHSQVVEGLEITTFQVLCSLMPSCCC